MPSESPSISRRFAADGTAGGRGPATAFHLDGPTRRLDPRVNAFRPDIADVALAGALFAPHYATPMALMAASATMMRKAAGADAEAVSQLLPGEGFAALDVAGGWAWGFSLHDHYVGYVPAALLGAPSERSHKVSVREALVFAGPSIKTPAIATLPFGARVAGTLSGTFLDTGAGFIHRRHVAPLDALSGDPVTVAESFLGMPYLWGGRGADGIDCSGLVQAALGACGISAPRDTDMQREMLGTALPEEARLRRGDIVNFPGHVGLMVDENNLLHANAHWMGVVIEPLADVVARLEHSHDRPILSRRRMEA
ncbi:C40 family peptidase [Rhizorhabdus dicambivorans]|uniref:Glycoside hydrolase n=1 Tax=Rhizorhabdus dicambivorans TaxID=1850238 RepID=A0A2A4G2H1_9SPHN|nr:NlpC/P60 family protein [Rhizorhabdus dicambivorans]ATE64944.1 glycoside hydrolase [Rhizorhabdus dicambivorans]PCE44218.1 glycoside hydrolase [Rhizorhabdus dicambivorans]